MLDHPETAQGSIAQMARVSLAPLGHFDDCLDNDCASFLRSARRYEDTSFEPLPGGIISFNDFADGVRIKSQMRDRHHDGAPYSGGSANRSLSHRAPGVVPLPVMAVNIMARAPLR